MFEQIYAVVAEIPEGKVMSYADVARAAGVKSARWVGRAMHENDDPETVPCHRVVHSDGALAPGYAFGGKDVQKQRLLDEGVVFIGDKVDMSTCTSVTHMF
jgi:methylated-DNA-protein-cysteine methyltransferase-like protein